MMLLERLRSETRPAHERIERAMRLPERIATRQDYKCLLERFYGFHLVWETLGRRLLEDDAFFQPRCKASLIRRDLLALGAQDEDIASLPLCPRLDFLDGRPAAFGAMYVVEGSSLGGALIAQEVGRILGLGAETGCAYFRAYGRDVGRMWRAFGERLAAISSAKTDDLVVAAAGSTFRTLERWLCGGRAIA